MYLYTHVNLRKYMYTPYIEREDELDNVVCIYAYICMYLYIYLYIYIFIYIYMYLCNHVNLRKYMYTPYIEREDELDNVVCTCVFIYVCTCVFIYVNNVVCIYAYKYVFMYIYIYVCVYIYIYIHLYVFIYSCKPEKIYVYTIYREREGVR
jgi:hypothetical protein